MSEGTIILIIISICIIFIAGLYVGEWVGWQRGWDEARQAERRLVKPANTSRG